MSGLVHEHGRLELYSLLSIGASSCSQRCGSSGVILSRYDHVSDALATLHWLRLPQRVDFKAAVMVFRVLHGLVPPHLNDLVRVADLPGRRPLHSSSSHQLRVSSTIPAHNRRSTLISSRCIAPLQLIAI